MRRPEITPQDFLNLDENNEGGLNSLESRLSRFGLLENPMAPILGPFGAMERLGMGSLLAPEKRSINATAAVCTAILNMKKGIN